MTLLGHFWGSRRLFSLKGMDKENLTMGFCGWADFNERNKIYHDNEWGVPVHDDRKMFEHLMLECMQCGLSKTISKDLKKRALSTWGK
nr:DNA-3-methyladenine glycosylase I [Butyrivibrio sp. FCS014]